MGKKRKHVPAALHSELTEYSSLLRALRTTNTLDVASQLTQSQPTSLYADDDDDDDLPDIETPADLADLDLPIDDIPPQTPDPSSLPGSPSTASSSRKRPHQQFESESPDNLAKKPRKHDTWTRWPLLAGDVVIPEWTLEDEVKLIAANALRRPPSTDVHQFAEVQPERRPATAVDDEGGPEDDPWLAPLTQVSEHFLARTLAALAAHVPLSERSMQNRINPLNWEVVLNTLGAYGGPDVDPGRGLVNAKTVATVKQRLEAIYGPSKSAASHRVSQRDAAIQTLRDRLKPYELSFLELARDPSPQNMILPVPFGYRGKKKSQARPKEPQWK